MKISNLVTLKGAPEITGVIISIHGRKANIRWSQHFSQLVDLGKLTLAAHIHKPQNRKENSR